MKKIVFIIIFLSITYFTYGQRLVDSAKTLSLIAHYSFDFPALDMKDRYGNNNGVGAELSYKTSKNVLFALDYNYIFGNNVKIEDSIFKGISTSDGFIIDQNGMYAEVFCYERGFSVIAKAGYQFQLPTKYYSGIQVMGGGGFLQHKIRIENRENVAPQIIGDYAKGYDYLRNGPAGYLYVGYVFHANQKIIKFTAGFDCLFAFTQSRRDYLFPIQGPDKGTHFDMIYGFKLGWIINLYKSNKTENKKYYFN